MIENVKGGGGLPKKTGQNILVSMIHEILHAHVDA